MFDTIDKGNGRSSENALGFYQYVNGLETKNRTGTPLSMKNFLSNRWSLLQKNTADKKQRVVEPNPKGNAYNKTLVTKLLKSLQRREQKYHKGEGRELAVKFWLLGISETQSMKSQ